MASVLLIARQKTLPGSTRLRTFMRSSMHWTNTFVLIRCRRW